MNETPFDIASKFAEKATATQDEVMKEFYLKQADKYFSLDIDERRCQLNEQKSGAQITIMEYKGNIYQTSSNQIGAVGENATAEGNNFAQIVISQVKDEINQDKLIVEIQELLPKLKEIAKSTDKTEAYEAVAEANKALKLAQSGNKEDALQIIENLKPNIEPVLKEESPQIKILYQKSDLIASDLEMSRIEPWRSIDPRRFLIESNGINDIEQGEILDRLERFGICQIRISLQTPEEYVIESLYKLMGYPSETQNDHTGIVKDLLPKSGIEANTGSSAGDLGFHVDGTQHDLQPAMLIFQYVRTAPLGGNSRFADMARVLLDIESERRERLMINLARQDVAHFSKKDMDYVGPIFSFPDSHNLACRIRYDEVIDIKPECNDDFELLKTMFNDPKYQILFKPRPGDLIIFDNWRVMHARDEIYSNEQRHHRRVWLNHLRLELQPKCFLGIRPVSDQIKAKIKEMNGL